MLHIDLPFVPRVGLYLQNFTHKNQYLWNCSCPICGDRTGEGKLKRRFFIYRPGTANNLNAKCHKCGYSTSFGSFLQMQFPEMFKEYVYLRYQETSKKHVPHANFEAEAKKVLKTTAIGLTPCKPPVTPAAPAALTIDAALDALTPCAQLAPEHPVAKFLQKRQIPRDQWHLLYYTLKFNAYVNSLVPRKISKKAEEHPRLVIPYLDAHGKMFALAGRAFGAHDLRYITIKLDARDRIYGLDRLDVSKRIYAVEGQIDSLFLPNCIAVSGSNFDCEYIRGLKSMITLVPDNEPRSPEICRLIKKHIKKGYRVCMLPRSVKQKDINDMILAGRTSKELVQLIDDNTYHDAAALLQFSYWSQTDDK